MRVKLISTYDYDGIEIAMYRHEEDINYFCERHNVVSIDVGIHKSTHIIKSMIVYKEVADLLKEGEWMGELKYQLENSINKRISDLQQKLRPKETCTWCIHKPVCVYFDETHIEKAEQCKHFHDVGCP